MKGSRLWDDLIYELDQANKAGNLQFEIGLSSNDTGKFSTESVHIEIVAPSPYLAAKGPGSSDRGGRRLTSNTVSAVIRLVRRGKPVALIPGDIDPIGLEYLSSSGFEAAAPIAVFPHHGGKPSKGDMTEFAYKFCEIVEPENVIFSTGRGRYNTPRPEIIAAVCKKCPKVRILCTQLSEHCASLLPEDQPSHLSGKFSRGLEHNRCCAGTIFIPLDNSTRTLFPLPEDHLEFIRKAAPTALCMRPFQ